MGLDNVRREEQALQNLLTGQAQRSSGREPPAVVVETEAGGGGGGGDGGAKAKLSGPNAIPIGTQVELRNIRGNAELSGQEGVVTGYVASRCAVTLKDGRGPFNIKPKDLLVFEDADD